MSDLDPALRPVLAVAADRLEQRSLQPVGRFRVTGLDRDTRHALSGLLGRTVVRDQITLDLAELDDIATIRLGLPGGIVQTCQEVLGRRLVDRAAGRRDRAEQRAADGLRKTAGVQMWRMGAADYLEAVAASAAAVPLEGRPLDTPWDRELQRVMVETGVAVHEELLLPGLLQE